MIEGGKYSCITRQSTDPVCTPAPAEPIGSLLEDAIKKLQEIDSRLSCVVDRISGPAPASLCAQGQTPNTPGILSERRAQVRQILMSIDNITDSLNSLERLTNLL